MARLDAGNPNVDVEIAGDEVSHMGWKRLDIRLGEEDIEFWL